MAATFDAKAVLDTTVNGTTSVTATNLTVGAGSNRALVVQFAFSLHSPTSLAVTWDFGGSAQPCASIVAANGAATVARAELWGLVNPVSGAKSLKAAWTGASDVCMNGVSWTGVNQTGGVTTFPHSTSNTGSSSGGPNTQATVTVTSAVGNAVMDASCGDTGNYNSSNQTSTYIDNTPANMGGAGSRAAGAATVTLSWNETTGATNKWVSVGTDILAAASGSAFTQTLTESVTLSDVLANRTGKVFAESVTWSDVLTTTKVFLRTLTEVFTFSDTLTRSTGKVLSDAWTLSDVLGRFVGKTLSDLWTPSDTLVKQTQKPLTESVTLSDVLSTVKVFLRTLTESLTWSDTLARRTSKTLTETATLSDVLSTASRYFRTLTETLTFSDVFSTLAQAILAAAKACETFFLGADPLARVPGDSTALAVAAASTLDSVTADSHLARPGADPLLVVQLDLTTFTDVGC